MKDRLWYMEVAAAGFGALLLAATVCVCALLALRTSTQHKHDRLMVEAKVSALPGAPGWRQCLLQHWLLRSPLHPPGWLQCLLLH